MPSWQFVKVDNLHHQVNAFTKPWQNVDICRCWRQSLKPYSSEQWVMPNDIIIMSEMPKMSSKCQSNCLNQQYITLINFVLTRVILIKDSSTEFITRVSSKFYINHLSFIQITIQTKPVLKTNYSNYENYQFNSS